MINTAERIDDFPHLLEIMVGLDRHDLVGAYPYPKQPAQTARTGLGLSADVYTRLAYNSE